MNGEYLKDSKGLLVLVTESQRDKLCKAFKVGIKFLNFMCSVTGSQCRSQF